MSNNDFQRDAAARLRSLARALNEPVSEVDSMSDEQVRSYLAEHGSDTAKLRDALTGRIASLKAQKARLEKPLDAPTSPESSTTHDALSHGLRERLHELGLKVRPFALAINVPVGTATELVRGHLDALPDKLIDRTADVCRMSFDDAAFMMGRIPSSQPRQAMLLRSKGTDGQLPIERKTFREVMLLCKASGDLSLAQEEDWNEELLP